MTNPRVRPVNDRPLRMGSDFVLYWMTAFRRPRWNHSLDRAIRHARAGGKPLVVLEALRVDYRWASDRLHRFVLDGMADNQKAFASSPVTYYPYVEPNPGAGSGLLESLAERAVVVVTDDFPSFFLPRMIASAGRRLDALGVRLEAVDGNGLYPMYDTERVFSRAFDFRRHLQKRLPHFFEDRPVAEPLRRLELPKSSIPKKIRDRWPEAPSRLLQGRDSLSPFPIDHDVAPSPEKGGISAARARLDTFLDERLERYAAERNHPDADAASGFSPYLHFGHLSPHEIFWRIAKREDWSPDRTSMKTKGARNGFWNMSDNAEAFLDELITWRELGYNLCAHHRDYDTYGSLPEWARRTLADHAGDERTHTFDLERFEHSQTHDSLWNAAERQLVREGRMQNYLRMLWGKKVLEWSKSPEEALAVLIELNNKYALDGRNPNSYSGIFWIFGRYDRAWGPERPIFGKVRYMSSSSTLRKLKLSHYLERYGSTDPA
jgi:deoxyribodipyrimidine photo-lyase